MTTPESEAKKRAFAWFRQRTAELTGTTLDANGDLDEDALTIEEVHGAMAVIQAEVAVAGGLRRAVRDEELVEQITEVLGALSDEERDEIRRLMHMDDQ